MNSKTMPSQIVKAEEEHEKLFTHKFKLEEKQHSRTNLEETISESDTDSNTVHDI